MDSRTRIDLLVTDAGLPGGMSGRQLADPERQRRPGLKVLFRRARVQPFFHHIRDSTA
ncbi:MAG: hypothetical protein ABI224_02690 [Acetobacteraceae bacterium]